MVPKNFGYFSRSSADDRVLGGTSDRDGASTSNTFFSFHCAWYFFSMAIRVSLFSVWINKKQLAVNPPGNAR